MKIPIFIFATALICGFKAEQVLVKTKLGGIQGQVETAINSEKRYAAFTSVPYAKPPVGNLRFKDPQMASAWQGTLEATGKSPQCPQLGLDPQKLTQNPEDLEGQEDCLYLNVYMPLDSKGQKFDKKLPVMVWIHGGAYVKGNNFGLYGPDYFMADSDNPVILVAMNYRLGILGFLSLGDEVISGNMGLKDQSLALQWVQDNIEGFGGDAQKVTIFGESAGGGSVMAHVLSPWSSGLFAKAIIQSPSAGGLLDLRTLITTQEPHYYAQQVLDNLELEDDLEQLNSLQILQELQKVPVHELVARNGLFEKFMFAKNPWKPIVDKHASKPFIPDDPKVLVSDGQFNKVPIIIGGNQDEGSMYLAQFLLNPELFEEVHENFDVDGPLLFLNVEEDEVHEQDSATAHLIKNEYLDGLHTNFTLDNWQRIAKIFSDIVWLVPIDIQTRLLVEQSDHPIFYYRFKYNGDVSLPMLYANYDKISKYDFGTCHADDLFVLFRQESIKEDLKDQKMIKKMVNLWTNFAYTGVPDPEWQVLSKDNHQWAALDHRKLRMEWNEDFAHKIEFVRSMFEVLNGYRNVKFQDHPAVQAMLEQPNLEEDAIEFPDIAEIEKNLGPAPDFHDEL